MAAFVVLWVFVLGSEIFQMRSWVLQSVVNVDLGWPTLVLVKGLVGSARLLRSGWRFEVLVRRIVGEVKSKVPFKLDEVN